MVRFTPTFMNSEDRDEGDEWVDEGIKVFIGTVSPSHHVQIWHM